MTPYDPELFDLILKKYKDRFLILTFKAGYAGNLVSRIIKSSNQYHCKEDDPLRFPDSTEGFPADPFYKGLDFKVQHLACVHQEDTLNRDRNELTKKENYLEWLQILKFTDYQVNIMTHDFSLEEKYTEIKCIRIFGKFDDSYRDQRLNWNKPFTEIEPSNNKLVYNLNINKLLSEDYDEFEDEYLKLTWAFNLDCKINSVRSFILLWREKQKRLVKYS